MEPSEVKGKLSAAGVSEDAIEKLVAERMLDAELLAETSDKDLREIGLLMGDAKRVKRVFPTAAAEPVPASAPAAPAPSAVPGNVTVVLKNPEPPTDDEILNGVKDKDEDAIEEARVRWGGNAVYVTANDGKLDVAATLEAVKFFKKHGVRDRFENSEKQSVRVLTLDQLVDAEENLNPLTLEVLVPGEPMGALTEEQRLLIAFGVVCGAVKANADEDGVIDSVTRMTSRWQTVQTDLKRAQAAEDDQYRQARKRLRCKSSEVSNRSSAGASGSGFALGAAAATADDRPNVFNLKRLGGMETQAMVQALLSAFPGYMDVVQLFSYELGEDLRSHVASGAMSNVMMEVVQWADQTSRLEELLQGARRQNPGNEKLKSFCLRHGIG